MVVTDAGGDVTHLLLTCRDQPVDFLIRVAAERRLVTEAAAPTYLLDEVVGWEAVVGRYLDLPACPGRQARRARCLVSFGQVSVRAPKPHPTLTYWVVRVWEVDAPADVEPIEWRLMSSVSVATPDDALERLAWYTARWVVEDYHQCLKTGCAIERRDLEDAQRIQRLLGFLALVAVRLLQLRDASRLTPEAAATRVVDPLLVHLLAARLRLSAPGLTVRAFFRGVAQLGGFLGRKGDGDPGWQTLWRGWLYLDTLAQGARLATTMQGTTPGS